MKINVPSPEEFRKEKREKRLRFIKGLMIGMLFFGLGSWRLLSGDINEVETYTWIALGFGVLSFGFFAMWTGADFWKRIFRQ